MAEDGKTSGILSDRAWPLYGAAFSTALSLSICWTAMPFVLSGMGGTKAHVGNAPMANGLAYTAALFLTGSLLGHLDVKRATRAAIGVALAGAGMMLLAVWLGGRSEGGARLVWIWAIVGAGVVVGAAMALHWPFLMSWVSARYEGVELNRRLGRYNGSWSGGAVIGPLIGAWLVGIDPLWPMTAAVGAFAVALAMLFVARNGTGRAAAPSSEAVPDAPRDTRLLADYRWMSRVAMFCAWATYSIIRTQFALRFVDIGFSEPQFGVYLTTFALCNFLALVGAGRWAFWHFRAIWLFVAQLMYLAALLMVLYGETLGVFYCSSVVLGLAFGFAYSSHLYYGASTSRKRSVRMVIHELVISVGIAIGSGAGGYLAEHAGWAAAHWFAVGLIGLGGVMQLVIHLGSRALAARQR